MKELVRGGTAVSRLRLPFVLTVLTYLGRVFGR